MSCEKYEQMISPYVDNELSDKEKEELEQHIKDCDKCREELQAITFMRNIMSNSEQKLVTPPSKMKRRIYHHIYRDLLIMFTGLVIIISMVSISGGLAQLLLFSRIPVGVRTLFIAGIILLICGLIVLLYDIFIDMFKILKKNK